MYTVGEMLCKNAICLYLTANVCASEVNTICCCVFKEHKHFKVVDLCKTKPLTSK